MVQFIFGRGFGNTTKNLSIQFLFGPTVLNATNIWITILVLCDMFPFLGQLDWTRITLKQDIQYIILVL